MDVLPAIASRCDIDQLRTILGSLSLLACQTENEGASLIGTKTLINIFVTRFSNLDVPACDAALSGLFEVLSSNSESAVAAALEFWLNLRCSQNGRLFSASSSLSAGTFVDIGRYLTAVITLLESTTRWKLYMMVLDGLYIQFQDPTLFANCQSQIENLCTHLCVLITDEKACTNLKDIPTSFKRSSIYTTIYRLLGTLLPYCLLSSRTLVDDVLQAFQLGLHRWPTTAKYCLQTLTLALSMFPSNMTRLLSSTLLKISRITSLSMAPHVLEFLSTLGRNPQIYVNCSDDELKRIFGIIVQYISSPQKDIESEFVVQLAYHVVTVWFVSLRLSDRRRYVPFIIRYMLPHGSLEDAAATANLSENVELILDILLQNTFVDCSLRPEATFKSDADRNAKDVQERHWIYGNALMSIRSGMQKGWCEIIIRRSSGVLAFWSRLENQGRSFLVDNDGVRLGASTEWHLFAHDNVGGQAAAPSEELEKNPLLQRLRHGRSASVGSITGLEDLGGESNAKAFTEPATATSSNESIGALQSASRTRSISFSSRNMKSVEDNGAAFFQMQFHSQALMDPAFFLLQLSQYPASAGYSPPIVLPEDDATHRSIKVLDRIPVVDLHKIGLVYVAPNQEAEVSILANTYGSRLYTKFLSALGRWSNSPTCREPTLVDLIHPHLRWMGNTD
ncbi:tuberin-domain-containing protein [Chytridium lagenaria]|nr:tuberin-domain-containing protein [Chytridium lagenaria]